MRRFAVELSKQLAEFLAPRLERDGGVIALADVFCLYNRARGTELVSPDDVLAAAKLFPKVGAPMALRTFPSGVTVVQSAAHGDEAVCGRLRALAAAPGDAAAGGVPGLGPGLSAGDVARASGVSVAIVREQLLTAEAAGVLCRDQGPEGLRFFRNFFRDAAPGV